MNLSERITVDPEQCGGKPCIRGMRIRVRDILEMLGSGINMVTGDYSRGASGFWVENGEIAYPVQEITIAGNLKEIYRGITAIGNDVLRHGSRQCGSILIEQMTIAGD